MLSISDKDYFETKIRHFVPTKIFKNQGKYLLFCPKECSGTALVGNNKRNNISALASQNKKKKLTTIGVNMYINPLIFA